MALPPTVLRDSSILDAAIDYTRRGWPLVLLMPGLKRPWNRPHGYQDQPPPTQYELRGSFAINPNLNIGLLTGNGIIALDIDEKPGKMSGSEALAALEALHGPLPPTLTSITGGGGQHRIFFLPPGYEFKGMLPVIKSWLIETTGKATGGVIDTQYTGKLIVLPPSIHPDGPRYRWEDPDAEIATLPLAWCQEPVTLTLEDPERRTRRGRQAPRRVVAVEDAEAHERLENVDPDALLGRETLLLLDAEVTDDTDRSHRMWKAILGTARERFDPDSLYVRMLDSPLGDGLREHGRAWFDRNMLAAHRYIIERSLSAEDAEALRSRPDEIPSRYTFTGRNGKRQTISKKNLQIAWYALLDAAKQQETTAPMVGTHLLNAATGMHQDTARKALQAFESLGWVSPEDVSHGPLMSAYRYHLCLTEPKPTGRANSMRRGKPKLDIDEWITELLANGSVSSQEIQARAAGAGIPIRTLRRHAKSIGVQFFRTLEGTTEWKVADLDFRTGGRSNASSLLNIDELPLDGLMNLDEASLVSTVTTPPNNLLCLSIPSEVQCPDLDPKNEKVPLTCMGPLLLPEGLHESTEGTDTTGSGDLLLNFDDDAVSSGGRYWYEPPEPPGSDWTQRRCRKCGGMTVSVRDAESRTRIFRMDAMPSEYGTLMVVDERWKLPQVSTVTNRVAAKQYTAHADTCGRVAEGPEAVPALPEPREPMTAIPEPRPPMSEEELQASKDRLVARIKGANPQAYPPEPRSGNGARSD